MLGAGTDKRGR